LAITSQAGDANFNLPFPVHKQLGQAREAGKGGGEGAEDIPGALHDLERVATAHQARHHVASKRGAETRITIIQQPHDLQGRGASAEDLSQRGTKLSAKLLESVHLELLEAGAARLQHGGQLTKQRLETDDRHEIGKSEGLERRRDEVGEGDFLVSIEVQPYGPQLREVHTAATCSTLTKVTSARSRRRNMPPDKISR
jgi:hypothetical protein